MFLDEIHQKTEGLGGNRIGLDFRTDIVGFFPIKGAKHMPDVFLFGTVLDAVIVEISGVDGVDRCLIDSRKLENSVELGSVKRRNDDQFAGRINGHIPFQFVKGGRRHIKRGLVLEHRGFPRENIGHCNTVDQRFAHLFPYCAFL